MLKRAKRASHIDPPASSYAIMRRAGPYRGENPGPGEDVEGELEPRPGIREQPGSKPVKLRTSKCFPVFPRNGPPICALVSSVLECRVLTQAGPRIRFAGRGAIIPRYA